MLNGARLPEKTSIEGAMSVVEKTVGRLTDVPYNNNNNVILMN